MALKWYFSEDTGQMSWRASKRTGTEPRVVEEPIQPCVFCEGSGEKPPGTRCSVCRGKGAVQIDPPAVRCALCKGRGGAGAVSITRPRDEAP